MKTPKGIRERDAEEIRKAKRLEPLRKSGRERYARFEQLDDDEPLLPTRRESALDYLDPEE